MLTFDTTLIGLCVLFAIAAGIIAWRVPKLRESALVGLGVVLALLGARGLLAIFQRRSKQGEDAAKAGRDLKSIRTGRIEHVKKVQHDLDQHRKDEWDVAEQARLAQEKLKERSVTPTDLKS